MTLTHLDRVQGCLLGGAIGDAVGWPLEFETDPKKLVINPTEAWEVTDDTQMTLFTYEALITYGDDIHEMALAYDRWLTTQDFDAQPTDHATGLAAQPWLYAVRAPGRTCVTALTEARRYREIGLSALNDSKGCGTVMRSAPFGLMGWTPERTYHTARHAAALTHGHPTAQHAAAAFAILIGALMDDRPLLDATHAAIGAADTFGHDDADETLGALTDALFIANHPHLPITELGQGWTAEEALSIAVCAALRNPDPLDALREATQHPGDSDSTGAICGNILGTHHGKNKLPSIETQASHTINQLTTHLQSQP